MNPYRHCKIITYQLHNTKKSFLKFIKSIFCYHNGNRSFSRLSNGQKYVIYKCNKCSYVQEYLDPPLPWNFIKNEHP